MRLFSFCLLLLFVCAACEGTSPETNNPEPVTEPVPVAPDVNDRTYVVGQRVGLITADMTPADVRKIYGDDQFPEATLNGPEGITYPGFHLFPGTDDELNISLDSTGYYAYTTNPGSHWTSAEHGIRVGTSLKDLERLNGGPFIFSGFGWDYGGNVYDWLGGKLAGHRVRLVYEYDMVYEKEDRDFLKAAVGDQPVRSDEASLADKGIRVSQLYIGSGK